MLQVMPSDKEFESGHVKKEDTTAFSSLFHIIKEKASKQDFFIIGLLKNIMSRGLVFHVESPGGHSIKFKIGMLIWADFQSTQKNDRPKIFKPKKMTELFSSPHSYPFCTTS